MTDQIGAAVAPMVAALGDEGVLVRLGTTVDVETAARVRGLASRLRDASLPGVREVVCSYASLALYLESGETQEAVIAAARYLAGMPEPADPHEPDEDRVAPPAPREHVIPVRYDGPDLAEVARCCSLSEDEVVRRHHERTYDAFAVGFVPGFAYLGVLDDALHLPRRPQPRTRVPAGSVAIAGAQTAVYPLVTPGGWHLIGHTSTTLFDPSRDEPALIAAGDRVRFQPVDG